MYQCGHAFQNGDQRSVLVARAGLDGAVIGRVIKKVGSSFEVKASENSDLKDAVRNVHEVSVVYLQRIDPNLGENTHETKLSHTRKVSVRSNLGTELKYVSPDAHRRHGALRGLASSCSSIFWSVSAARVEAEFRDDVAHLQGELRLR